jgi:hypothetical protein
MASVTRANEAVKVLAPKQERAARTGGSRHELSPHHGRPNS